MAIRKSASAVLRFCALGVALFLLLFADGPLLLSTGLTGALFKEAEALCREPGTQELVFLCLGIYFLGFVFLNVRAGARGADRDPAATTGFRQRFAGAMTRLNPVFWVMVLLWISAIAYVHSETPSAPAVTLLAGAAVGQAALWIGTRPVDRRNVGKGASYAAWIWVVLGILLAAASTWSAHPLLTRQYQYRGEYRWSGAWDNPNVYGLFMATGIVLVIGLAVSWTGPIRGLHLRQGSSGPGKERWTARALKLFVAGLCLIGLVLMSRGLLFSYSRGAWLAALAGLVYLGFQAFRRLGSWAVEHGSDRVSSSSFNLFGLWLRQRARTLLVIGLSAMVLGFWHFRHTEWRPLRRALSVANMNDFSWRNRVTTWEGALQMMAERPWLGFGWDRPEQIFDKYYSPPKLEDSSSVQLNDYLMLGVTLGLPALFCFGAYVWLSLFGRCNTVDENLRGLGKFSSSGLPPSSSSSSSSELLRRVTFRAAAFGLLVGFWFDAGLFRLGTASLFWIVLELGREDRQPAAIPLRENSELLGNYAAAVLAMAAFLTALFWAKARDPFQRMEFSLRTAGGNGVKGMVVLPKSPKPMPVVVYLHGAGGNVVQDGRTLTLFAEQNVAAVGIQYDETKPGLFDEQFIALQRYLSGQSWARSNATAWVGLSLGANLSLGFALRHPECQPQLLVRIAGGAVDGLGAQLEGLGVSGGNAMNQSLSTNLSVLFVHGEHDEIFPASECRKVVESLQKAGVPVALRILPGQSHGFGENRLLVMRAVGEYCAGYFDAHIAERRAPVRVNTRPSYWYYWLPIVAVFGGARLLTSRFLSGILEGPLLSPTLSSTCVEERGAAAPSGPFVGTLSKQSHFGNHPMKRMSSKALACVAWVLAIGAVAETALRVGLPFMTISDTRLRLTRQWLVKPGLRGDFDSLRHEPVWEGQKINALLEHLELADLTRTCFYRDHDRAVYQEYILSPAIGGGVSGDVRWRRMLWENVWPRVRRESDPVAAAFVVARFLRERVTVLPGPMGETGVREVWETGMADEAGFQRLYVAALRSVGIAARLSAGGQAELYAQGQWQPAPQPLVLRTSLLLQPANVAMRQLNTSADSR